MDTCGRSAYTSYVAVEVGVREFRENLSEWLDRAAAGEVIVVTERGKPKAQITGTGYWVKREQLAREGMLRKAAGPRRKIPAPRGPVLQDSPGTTAILRARGVLDDD